MDGKGCECFARCEADCVCDADWTPAEVVRLHAELTAAQKDAERYRWIRTGDCAGDLVSLFVGDQLDAEIDAAIASEE